jgi:hypothetical protein
MLSVSTPAVRLFFHPAIVDSARRRPRLASQQDIFRHGHGRHQTEFLVNNRDSRLRRRPGRRKLLDPAVQQDIPGFGAVDASEYFHQSALTGSILAHKRMDLAGMKHKLDAIQNPHAGEFLHDFPHLQENPILLRGIVSAPRVACLLRLHHFIGSKSTCFQSQKT